MKVDAAGWYRLVSRHGWIGTQAFTAATASMAIANLMHARFVLAKRGEGRRT